MKTFCRAGMVSCLFSVILGQGVLAQQRENKTQAPFVPHRALPKSERNRQEALKAYGIGMWCLGNNRLLEAAEHLENAAKLDPDAALVAKALIPVYLALNRMQDALDACKNYLKLEADDYETWHLYAGQLKDFGRPKEAIEAMKQAVASPSVHSRPQQLALLWFDLGILQENSGDRSAAESAFRKAKQVLIEDRKSILEEGEVKAGQLDAEIAKTWEWIGKVCRKAKKYRAAVQAYQKAQGVIRLQLEDADGALPISLTLAEIHLELGELKKAQAELEEYLKSQPSGPEAYEMEIDVLAKLGEESAIIPTLERYAGADRHNAGLQLLLARQYVREKQWAKAKTKFQELAKDNPSPEIYRGLFNLHKELAEIDSILTTLDTSLAKAKSKDKEPGDPASASEARAMITVLGEDGELVTELIKKAKGRLEDREPLDRATWELLAALAARSGQVKEAEAFYRACLAQGAAVFVEAEIYFGLVQVLWREHKYQDIVDICRRGLKESQAVHFGWFHRNLALALIHLDKIDEALEEADKVISLAGDGNRLPGRLLRAQIFSYGDRHDKAIAECMALLKEASKPEDLRQVRYYLSGFYTAAHDLPRAEEQLRLILQDDAGDATAHNDLGYLLADQGKNLAEAEELIRKAIALDREQKQKQVKVGPNDDKDNAAFVDSLGWVLFRRGRLEEAKQELEKALALSEHDDLGGEDPVIWDHLGDVYFRLDDKAKARTLWKKSVRLYEQEKRRKLDDQYQTLKHKLKLLESP